MKCRVSAAHTRIVCIEVSMRNKVNMGYYGINYWQSKEVNLDETSSMALD